MGFTLVISLMCCLIFLRIRTAQANCYDTGNFTANSTYSKNRDTIAASLASNAVANGGFYNSTVGNGSDIVYATAMCRGDLSESKCSTCVNTTAYDLISQCPVQYEAVSLDGGDCIIHYANKYIFGVLEMDPVLTRTNTGTISWNSSGFYETWADLMAKLKNKAAAGTSKLKYAANKANYTLTQFIYALVQCTPDLSKSDCDDCLTQNIADYDNLYYGYQGGPVRRPSCIFRWDLYLFYNEVVDNAPPPSTPPPYSSLPSSPPTGDGGVSTKTIAIIVGLALVFIFVAVGLFLFCRQRKRRVKTVQQVTLDHDVIISSESSNFDFKTIREATDNFSDNNKLGQGGFGTVYKASNKQFTSVLVFQFCAYSE
ncbi:hypothetical protein ACFE04_002859 [Oxalis oulophora]